MATQRVAVVTGSNKGLGFGICKLLASKGVLVVLTARDELRGTEALEKLKGYGLSDNVIFHQLDVVDSNSISELADFIKNKYGRLDILVNSAGISGAILSADSIKEPENGAEEPVIGGMKESYELAIECLQINYYGKLKNIANEWAKEVLSDEPILTEERIDEVLNEFLKDFKAESLQAEGWPSVLSAYIVSKAAKTAYTRILAKKYPKFKINCVCPGRVKTDMTLQAGTLSIEEGAEFPVMLALLPDDGPSGFFFFQNEISSFE